VRSEASTGPERGARTERTRQHSLRLQGSAKAPPRQRLAGLNRLVRIGGPTGTRDGKGRRAEGREAR